MTAVAASTILVVDDEEDIRLLSQFMLEADGHTVLHAGDCESALATVRSQAVDLILLDIGLPDGSGFDVLATLRDEGFVPGIAIVIVSAFGMGTVSDKIEDLDASNYLRKPYDVEDLRTTVNKLLTPAS